MAADDVLYRIEAFIFETIQVMASGELPTFTFASRTPADQLVPFALKFNSPHHDRPAFAEQGGDNFGNEMEELQTIEGNCTLPEVWYKKESDGRLIHKDLISKNAVSAFNIVRVFRILDCVHEMLLLSKRCTQRELYYRLLDPPIFSSLAEVTGAISDVCSLLTVPRSSLNICCSSKGAVSGLIRIKDTYSQTWQDCTRVGLMGHSIPGDALEIEGIEFTSTAQYLLIIEKDAIFQRLTEDRLFDLVPTILVTGRGMPDICTRIFLHHLIKASPHLVVLGLVDWNPSGITILSTYKYGTVRMGPHDNQYSLPFLKWLGIRQKMLLEVPRTAFHPLSSRDFSLIKTLRPQFEHDREWTIELESMECSGLKCDIEALYRVVGITGFTHRLVQSILTRQFTS